MKWQKLCLFNSWTLHVTRRLEDSVVPCRGTYSWHTCTRSGNLASKWRQDAVDEEKIRGIWLHARKEVQRSCISPFSDTTYEYVDTFPDTMLFIGLKWFLTPSIILHVIFCKLVLSSLTFICPRDAVEVIGRFMASVLLCRAVLMYEIAGIRDWYNSSKDGLVTILPFKQPK